MPKKKKKQIREDLEVQDRVMAELRALVEAMPVEHVADTDSKIEKYLKTALKRALVGILAAFGKSVR